MRTELLDHGYLELVESWGSDERIVEAARMSTAKGFLGWGPTVCASCGGVGHLPTESSHIRSQCQACKGSGKVRGDERLLRFLWTHRHHTPFEMAGLTIEVQAPIFVFREWQRHRTQSYNELSARYTPLPDVNYLPTIERCIVVPAANRQAGKTTDRVPTHEEVLDWLAHLSQLYGKAEKIYQYGLQLGIPKELARLPVPVARYSRMRASANLRNWLHFLTLRMDPAAQWEIRQFANALGDVVTATFPRTWELFALDQSGRDA